MDSDAIRKLLAEATPGPWSISGVRFKNRDGNWHQILSYDARTKTDVSIALVGFDPKTGLGWRDAHLIAAAPDLAAEVLRLRDRLIAEEEAKIRLAYRAAEEIGKLKDALTEALPWVEAQLDDPANKPGAVRIRAALKEDDNACLVEAEDGA